MSGDGRIVEPAMSAQQRRVMADRRFVAGAVYPTIYLPWHPRSNSQGYVLEHIVIAERKLGRFIELPEEVHHINGDRYDNRPENLQVCANRQEHARLERRVA